jgi:hypothetical protein
MTSITVESRSAGPVDLRLTGDEATGTIWVPVWLVWDRQDILWWINEDPYIHPSAISQTDSLNVFRVPRRKWAAHPELAA